MLATVSGVGRGTQSAGHIVWCREGRGGGGGGQRENLVGVGPGVSYKIWTKP